MRYDENRPVAEKKPLSLCSKTHLTSWQKFNNDMIACTAPIKDLSANKMVYALSVSFPVQAFTREHFEQYITPAIVDSANTLSKIYKPGSNW